MNNQILNLVKLLAATAIMLMVACILIAVQQFEINNLRYDVKQQKALLEEQVMFNQGQLKFDKTVTGRLAK